MNVEGIMQYDIGPKHAVMGSALRISLGKTLSRGVEVKVAIHYSTSQECTALQWLDKE